MKKILCVLFCFLMPFAAMAEEWDVVDVADESAEAANSVTIMRADAMFGGLLLVNGQHPCPAGFDDSDIARVSSYARNVSVGSFWDDSSCSLHPVAIDALIELLTDAQSVGYTGYVLPRGFCYRSYEEQDALFQRQVEMYRERYPSYTEEQLYARARVSVNDPGTSEFNTGLSFCLYLYDGSSYYRTTPFYETGAGQWLYENSWKYGFVFRFPVEDYPFADTRDKSSVTGMSQKLNCYRYVGKGNAAVMNHLGLCLEEYIEYLQEHPHIAVFENGVKKYEITRQEVSDDAASFTVNINRMTNNYTMSLDNMGGLITVYEY